MSTESKLNFDPLLNTDPSKVTTLIDQGVEFIGRLVVTNGKTLLVCGSVIGSIESNGPVVVDSRAVVKGSITANALQVSGQVDRNAEGDLISVDGPLVLTESAVVNCDAESAGVKTAYGAVMSGMFRPREATKKAAPKLTEVPRFLVEAGRSLVDDEPVTQLPATESV